MVSDKKSTELSIIYQSADNGEVFLRDVLTGNDYIDEEGYEPGNFWGCCGGLEIVIDEYKVIFKSLDFHYLCKVINFLLHTLYKIKGKTSSWFDDGSPDSVTVQTTGGNSLIITVLSENVSISYLRKGETTDNEVRGDRFFAAILVNKNDFFNATAIALGEYFVILEQIINDNPGNNIADTMKAMLAVWKAV